jgi:hypothetical protein
VPQTLQQLPPQLRPLQQQLLPLPRLQPPLLLLLPLLATQCSLQVQLAVCFALLLGCHGHCRPQNLAGNQRQPLLLLLLLHLRVTAQPAVQLLLLLPQQPQQLLQPELHLPP